MSATLSSYYILRRLKFQRYLNPKTVFQTIHSIQQKLDSPQAARWNVRMPFWARRDRSASAASERIPSQSAERSISLLAADSSISTRAFAWRAQQCMFGSLFLNYINVKVRNPNRN